MGCRRLWVLINGLPPDASIWRVEGQQWGNREELLALVLERIDAWGLLQARLASDKKFHKYLPDKPIEITRPGEQKETRDHVVTDPREIAAFFA